MDTIASVDKLFVATRGFIFYKGKLLIIRESLKYVDGVNVSKWDLPGGRIKPGERFDESLLREVFEETGLKVKIGKVFDVEEWRPKVRDEQWQIVGICFECKALSFKVKLSEDHDDYKWIKPEDYTKYELILTIVPAFPKLLKLQS